MVKILVAEDDKSLNSLVHSYLVNNGYEAVSCYDGEEALSLRGNRISTW